MTQQTFDTVLDCVNFLSKTFNIIDTIDCDQYDPTSVLLYERIKKLHKDSFDSNDRIVFTLTKDYYKNSNPGLMLQSIQSMLNDVDISNFFVCLVSTNPATESDYQWVLKNVSQDLVPVHIYNCHGNFELIPSDGVPYTKFLKANTDGLSLRHKQLLFDSKTFCLVPWISMMLHTNSQVRPCCESNETVGNSSKSTLEEIWNDQPLCQMRTDMLAGNRIKSCQVCYDKESIGRDSLRKSVNRRFAKHVAKVDSTQDDGKLPKFELNYIDARFNNLCNLACLMCNPTNSSSWYQPAVRFGMIDRSQKALLIAGRNEKDIFQQLMSTIDTVERVYFAGGEPLMIDQFYQIVEELDRRGKHDVELVYNINMTKNKLKDKSIFDYWKNFKNISIGASLDGELERGEYLRVGTYWDDVVEFRHEMIKRRPDIDFYVSATLTLINALHLPDFHRSWVEQGLIEPKDFNIQPLYQPEYLRADSSPEKLKSAIANKYAEHLNWLRPNDPMGRATYSFESALNYVNTQRPFDPELFWNEVKKLDDYYGQDLLTVFPELVDLL